jgi:hypothetical protein
LTIRREQRFVQQFIPQPAVEAMAVILTNNFHRRNWWYVSACRCFSTNSARCGDDEGREPGCAEDVLAEKFQR